MTGDIPAAIPPPSGEGVADLRALIEAQGFQVIEGDFVRRDGSHSHFYLRPRDPRRLLQLAQQALDSCEVTHVDFAHEALQIDGGQ